MSPWEGIILGVIQGLTEFLPVSSSGHLVIAQSFMKGFRQPGVLFDVMLHFGTLLAVIFFLRRDLYEIVKAIVPKQPDNVDYALISIRRKTAVLIGVGTIFTCIIGFALKDKVHILFESVNVVAFMLLVTGFLLFLSDKIKNTEKFEKDMTITDSIIIGIVQGIAIVPGISRSGSTIAFGIFRKLDRETAARFSFLLSIPAVIGAVILESRHIVSVPSSDLIIYIAGTIAALLTGFMSLKLLFLIIKKRGLSIFAYYCWFVGIATLLFNI
ncbi:MAG: undecaprenyl-diphosphate phosphatase [Syntrophales bacterium]|nr:undecaprenyl-diphosphate phosphatase [Syntrophales bacterium]